MVCERCYRGCFHINDSVPTGTVIARATNCHHHMQGIGYAHVYSNYYDQSGIHSLTLMSVQPGSQIKLLFFDEQNCGVCSDKNNRALTDADKFYIKSNI